MKPEFLARKLARFFSAVLAFVKDLLMWQSDLFNVSFPSRNN